MSESVLVPPEGNSVKMVMHKGFLVHPELLKIVNEISSISGANKEEIIKSVNQLEHTTLVLEPKNIKTIQTISQSGQESRRKRRSKDKTKNRYFKKIFQKKIK